MANDETTAVGDVMAAEAIVSGNGGGNGALHNDAGETAPNGVETDYAGHESVVRVRGVTRVYDIGGTSVNALRGVDIDIKRGEYISIMGPSG